MALLVPPAAYVVHKEFNLLYQFWIHTEVGVAWCQLVLSCRLINRWLAIWVLWSGCSTHHHIIVCTMVTQCALTPSKPCTKDAVPNSFFLNQ